MLNLARIFKQFPNQLREGSFALQDVSLRIQPGEFVTLIGANGSGKSTLLKAVAGEISIERGTMEFSSDPVQKVTDLRSVTISKRACYFSRVFQDPALGSVSEFSLEENLVLARMKRKMNHSFFSRMKPAVTRSMESEFKERLFVLRMGLEKRLKEKAGNLSGGQRQALALVMAFYSCPKLVLLDEHCSALDPKSSQRIMEITAQLARTSNTAILMVTHELSHALKYSDRICIMEKGRMIFNLQDAEIRKKSVEGLLGLLQSAGLNSLPEEAMQVQEAIQIEDLI